MMPFTDEDVFDAMDIFRAEFEAWTVVPDKATEYNDKGTLRYSYSIVHDMRRCSKAAELPDAVVRASTTTFERMHLTTDAAKKYPMFRAIKAVMEHVDAP